MARVLFVTSPERGHVHPVRGVAARLLDGGHEVGWLGLPRFPEAALEGLPVERVACPLAPSDALPTEGEALARLLRDPPRLAAWIRGLLLDGAAAQVAPLRRALRDFGPDVVCPDPMQYGAVIAARLEGLPCTALSSSLNPVTPPDFDCALTRTVADLAADRAALFADHGLAPRFSVCDALSEELTAVFAPPRYASALAPLPSGVLALGPSRRAPRREPDGSIYVSFGSQAWWQPARIEKLVAAAEPLGRPMTLAAGALADSLTLPSFAAAHRWVDQLEALSRASVFVTHGGASAMMEALGAGVPTLVCPIANDQPIQAAFAQAAGVARGLDLETASVAELREALSALLQPTLEETARRERMRDAYAALDGAAAAAEAIAALAAR